MSLEITGRLQVLNNTQVVSDKFKKREFVIAIEEEINGKTYTNYAKMQCVQQKCEILEKFNEGDIVKVSFNIKGNSYEKNGKQVYISNLDAWRIELVSNADVAPQQAPSRSFYNPNPEGTDDLPF